MVSVSKGKKLWGLTSLPLQHPMLRPHKVDSQFIVTARMLFWKFCSLFIIYHLSCEHAQSIQMLCPKHLFLSNANENSANQPRLVVIDKRLIISQWIMNNDRPPAWNMGKVLRINCKSTLWGLKFYPQPGLHNLGSVYFCYACRLTITNLLPTSPASWVIIMSPHCIHDTLSLHQVIADTSEVAVDLREIP